MAAVPRAPVQSLAYALGLAARKLTAKEPAAPAAWLPGEGFSPLRDVVVALQPELYIADPAAALRVVLERAAASLGAERDERFPAIVFQVAARRMFGLDPSWVPPEGTKGYDGVVRGLLADARATSTRDQRAVTEHIRERVAAALLRQVRAARDPTVDPDGPPAYEPILIERTNLLRKAERLLADGRRVVLWGESGNGKTQIVMELAARTAGRVAVIRGSADRRSPFFAADVSRALNVAASTKLKQPVVGGPEARLALLLQTQGTFDLVVFDDANDDTITRFCTDAVVPVIVTCDKRPRVEFELSYVQVPALSASEAAAFVRQAFPNEDMAVAVRLAETLGNRPLALSLVHRMVTRGARSFAEIAEACAGEAAASLHAMVDILVQPVERSVVYVYEGLAAVVSQDDQALDVLDALLWITGSAPRALLTAALFNRSPTPSQQLRMDAALARLLELSVVTAREDNIEVNALTLSALRYILRKRAAPASSRFFMAVCAPAISAAQAWDETTDLLDDVAHAVQAEENDRIGAYRFLWSLQVAARVVILGGLTPQLHAGMFSLTESSSLLWQYDSALFASPNGQLQIALLTTDAGGIRVVGANGVVPIGEVAARRVHDLAIVSLAASDAFIRHRLDPEVAGEEQIRPYLTPDLWPTNTEQRAHKYMSDEPPEAVERTGRGAWTACGLLLSPWAIAHTSGSVSCVECEERPLLPKQWLDFLLPLQRLLNEWEDGGEAAETAKYVSSTVAYVIKHHVPPST